MNNRSIENSVATLPREPRFSIVIPLFNKRLHIRRAVNSVLRQANTHFELIVVDDGSTDGSVLEIDGITDERLRILYQKNQGVSAARNRGIDAAIYPFICFLDADDEWRSCFLDEMAGLIRRFPEGDLYCVRHEIVNPDGSVRGCRSAAGDGCSVIVTDFIDTYRKNPDLVNSSSACLRKEILKKIGGFPIGKNVGEDIYVWLKVSMEGTVVSSDRVCSVFYRDAENRTLTRTNQFPYHLEYFYSHSNLVPRLQRPLMRKFLRKNASLQVAGAAVSGHGHIAFKYALSLFKWDWLWGGFCFLIAITPRYLLAHIQKTRNSLRK